jgi:hypothetical protein
MRKLIIPLIGVIFVLISCTKIEEGKNFRVRGLKYYLRNFLYDSVQFDNPNNHRSYPNFIYFLENKVRILVLPYKNYQDTTNAFLTPMYEQNETDFPYNRDKKDKSLFTITTGSTTHTFKIVRVEKGRIIIKRINIPGGLQEERYVLMNKRVYFPNLVQ